MEQPARLLLIEDDVVIRSGMAAFMEDSGHEVLQAGDGDQGLAMCRSQPPDVLICDLRLPGTDGLDVIAAVADELPDTPVIVVSGITQVSDAVQALKAGAWDFLTKPIQDMTVLETSVQRVLARRRLMEENRRYREHLEVLNRQLGDALAQLEADQEAGRKSQFQLLPEDGWEFRGLRFQRRLFPSLYLSGDFVDYFPIDDRRCGFFIADVSGHGAASAFVTVVVKTLVEQYRDGFALEGDVTILHPEATLRRLDHDLRRQQLDKHITLFYGIIDCDTDRLSWSNAGQYPHPLLRSSGRVQRLDARGMPLGLFGEPRYRAEEAALPDGFALLLASDGLLEVTSRNALEALYASLEADRAADPGALAEALDLREGRSLPDDVTLLLITRDSAEHG